jgi:hypothetical protein
LQTRIAITIAITSAFATDHGFRISSSRQTCHSYNAATLCAGFVMGYCLVDLPLWVKRAMREGIDALLQDPRPLFAALQGGAPVAGPLRKLQLVWDDIRESDDPTLYLTGVVPKMQNRDWIKVEDDVSADFPRILDCNEGCKTKLQEVHMYAEGWRGGLMQENPLGLQQYMVCVEGEVRAEFQRLLYSLQDVL